MHLRVPVSLVLLVTRTHTPAQLCTITPSHHQRHHTTNTITPRRKREDVRSRAPPVTFADVAGVDSAKEELMEVVACLRDSQRCVG